MNAESPAGGAARLEVEIGLKTYLGAAGETHAALRGVDFTLEPGAVGALVGPSGCGKTTLLRIVSGLDGDFAGRVSGVEASRLAVVFQEPRLLPWRSVSDNLKLAAPGLSQREFERLTAWLGLSRHCGHFPGELSLGLARRVALARALAIEPDLLLLDEPLASLDAATSAALVAKLGEIFDARAITTLLVTHDVEAAARLADVVFVLSPRPARVLARIPVPASRSRGGADQLGETMRRIAAAQAGVFNAIA